jgi:hypothetical protein
VRVEIIRDGSGGTAESDLVFLGLEPAFTAHAVEALQSVLFPNGQVLPLRSADGEFYLWNVTNIVDALDEPGIKATRFSSGRIMRVDQWAFRTSVVNREVAFKVRQFPRGPVFITESFIDLFHAAGLLGLDPKPLWPQS